MTRSIGRAATKWRKRVRCPNPSLYVPPDPESLPQSPTLRSYPRGPFRVDRLAIPRSTDLQVWGDYRSPARVSILKPRVSSVVNLRHRPPAGHRTSLRDDACSLARELPEQPRARTIPRLQRELLPHVGVLSMLLRSRLCRAYARQCSNPPHPRLLSQRP